MIALKQDADRRECRRFRVQEGAFAAVSASNGQLGQIQDISLKGVAFQYLATERASARTDRPAEVQLLCREARLRLDGLPAVLVSDREHSVGPSFMDLKMRRMALQFGELDPEQRHRLADFIYRCALPAD
jgi:hypothetical protein